MRINEITYAIIGGATRVHSALGPGVLESAYHACLLHELRKSGLAVRDHVRLPVVYDGVAGGLRVGEADMIVNESVIVELKAIERTHKVHEAQLLSYLVLSGPTSGLLINFHELHLKDGIRRLVHRFQDYQAQLLRPPPLCVLCVLPSFPKEEARDPGKIPLIPGPAFFRGTTYLPSPGVRRL